MPLAAGLTKGLLGLSVTLFSPCSSVLSSAASSLAVSFTSMSFSTCRRTSRLVRMPLMADSSRTAFAISLSLWPATSRPRTIWSA